LHDRVPFAADQAIDRVRVRPVRTVGQFGEKFLDVLTMLIRWVAPSPGLVA
jgi:hypothetical protein